MTIRGDLPELRPRLVNIAADEVQDIGISPTGVCVVAEAHGEIFTVPVKKGDTRHISFARIYNGQNWTPTLTAPLTLPGISIRVGEYLFAVNGRELHAAITWTAPSMGLQASRRCCTWGTSR